MSQLVGSSGSRCLIRPGQILAGHLFNEPMRVVTVEVSGSASWSAGLVGVRSERFRSVSLAAGQLGSLAILDSAATCGGDARLLWLGVQAYSLAVT